MEFQMREKENFHLVIHPSNGQGELGQVEARGFFRVSHVGGRIKALGTYSVAFPGTLARSWMDNRAAKT